MGEYAEAYLWGDMTDPEDWEDYYLETKPMEPDMIAFEAKMLMGCINEWADEDDPPTTADLLEVLFPKLGRDQAALIADGLALLAAQNEPG